MAKISEPSFHSPEKTLTNLLATDVYDPATDQPKTRVIAEYMSTLQR